MNMKNPTIFFFFPSDVENGSSTKKSFFKKYNLVNACDIEGKMTPYNTSGYFNLNLPALIQRKKRQYFIKFSKFYPYKEPVNYIFRELARGKPYYTV